MSLAAGASNERNLLWRHEDGRIAIWELTNGVLVENAILETVGSVWQLSAAVDCTCDGQEDVLWRHDDGRLSYWELIDGDLISNG
jgi:hypothetical protein